MAKADFHDKPFDAGTKLKLDIFRGYIRKWLPVFLSRMTRPVVGVYDFFSGPGRDSEQSPGSPLIIHDEISEYLPDGQRSIAAGITVKLFFNDNYKYNYEQLKHEIAHWSPQIRDMVSQDNLDFKDAFDLKIREIQDIQSANLVILDQFGISSVNQEVFLQLLDCPKTDIMFFISSDTIRRFPEHENIRKYFAIDKELLDNPKEIHRIVANEYRHRIPVNKEYYVAPFSIKKDNGNIYGVIFGSSSLLGLRKFLEVCWELDGKTGEANFPIDDDKQLWEGQHSLFGDNVYKKTDRFNNDLRSHLKEQRRDNRELFRFCLEQGFLPGHLNKILSQLREDGGLIVVDSTGKPLRHNYITWKEYNSFKPRAFFIYRGE